MRAWVRRVVCAIGVIVSVAVPMASAAQDTGPASPPALVIEFARLGSDAARETMWLASPGLGDAAHLGALNKFAQATLEARNFQGAETAFASLTWLSVKVGDRSMQVRGLTGLASAIGQSGNVQRALALFDEALVLARAVGEPEGIRPVVANLGIVHRRLGNIAQALEYFDEALALARAAKDDAQIGRVLNNLGVLQMHLGHASRALEYFQESLSFKVDDGARGTLDIANTVNNIGAVYEEIGEFRQALSYFERALALYQRLDMLPASTTALSNIGHAHAALGDPKRAREFYDRALAQAESSRDAGAWATVLSNLGNLSRDAGRLDEAEDYQRRSLSIRENAGEALALTEGYADLSDVLARQGHLDQALPYAERAVVVATQAGLLNQLARAQVFEAQILQGLGRQQEAVAAFGRAADTVELLRERTPDGEAMRQTFLSQRLTPYVAMASLQASMGEPFEALVSLERARARTLLDVLATHRGSSRLDTDKSRDTERHLRYTVTSASMRLAADRLQRATPAVIATREQELQVARRARDEYLADLYAASPDLRLNRGEAPLLTRADIATVVPPGSAVVELLITGDVGWAFLVRPGGNGPVVTAHQLVMPASELTTLATRFVAQVSSRDLSFADTARRLYQGVFGQIDAALGDITHLVVIPDGAFWRVPFQALITGRGRFVIEERAVSYAPSLSALNAMRQRQARRTSVQPSLLALGDPQPGAGGRPRIPAASREVHAIAALYGADRSAVFVDRHATESVVRARAAEATVLHLATHGTFDDQSPMASHVMLASDGPNTGPTSDGRLEAWEVLSLNLRADLVVLSACQTARGTLGQGEGVVGFAWALLAAGASATVLSQWEVDSASTTDLMIAFHRGLKTGQGPQTVTVAAALQSAALTVLRMPAYRHPFYWAGFVAIGQ